MLSMVSSYARILECPDCRKTGMSSRGSVWMSTATNLFGTRHHDFAGFYIAEFQGVGQNLHFGLGFGGRIGIQLFVQVFAQFGFGQRSGVSALFFARKQPDEQVGQLDNQPRNGPEDVEHDQCGQCKEAQGGVGIKLKQDFGKEFGQEQDDDTREQRLDDKALEFTQVGEITVEEIRNELGRINTVHYQGDIVAHQHASMVVMNSAGFLVMMRRILAVKLSFFLSSSSLSLLEVT